MSGGGCGMDGTNRLPSPLASHDDVVKDSTLFWETLKGFHGVMGTKCMVPIIGGKELNLHVLYVEVTRRGGYNQVVSEKKWREVSGVFEFSPTTTSASYALRKHYFSLLFRYEQLYFFRLELELEEGLLVDDHHHTPAGPGQQQQYYSATGTIDGKFECGYLVSMKLGSEVLNGVLYHQSPSTSSSLCTAIVPYVVPPQTPRTRRRRKKKGSGGDPFRPKPNRSGYNFFFAEKHSMLKSLYPSREREFTKMIGESWNNLSAEERVVYQNYGLKDKERYQRELKEYRDKKKKMMMMAP
ncbi:high mobility group B protein 9 [Ipomoea triloba]|uniref:high mobility group B protein 9 n=1 Tax=Ipomoea triloba TaxID=35885 RepID=UPI00125DBF41|nr:high mobility group B protein 9 [Ipomoea triloba]